MDKYIYIILGILSLIEIYLIGFNISYMFGYYTGATDFLTYQEFQEEQPKKDIYEVLPIKQEKLYCSENNLYNYDLKICEI
jgi:hypothetical protein